MCIQKIICFVFTLVEGNLDPRALEGGWSEDAHSNVALHETHLVVFRRICR